MNLDLRLKDLRPPRINFVQLESAVERLRQFHKSSTGAESKQFLNRIEEIKGKLRSFGPTLSHAQFERVMNVVGKERLSMSLYTKFYDEKAIADWPMPPFDEAIADYLLGTNGASWHGGLRRRATQFFFETFGQLPATETLCCRLLESYSASDVPAAEPNRSWHQERATLFATEGPQWVANKGRPGESLNDLMERFGLDPKRSYCFCARLKECFLLNRLEVAALGQGTVFLRDLEKIKSDPYVGGVPMGAAALRIMTRRVLAEGGRWKGDWTDWLLKLGCDPGLPKGSDAYIKWWGCWNPTQAELECARRGVNRQTLEYFIQFLEQSLKATGNTAQFEARASFLRWLDETDKIIRFKLLLHPNAFYGLPKTYQDQRHRIAEIEGSGQGTSVIVIECVDDIWLVEGTHIFAIRAFHKKFPAPEVLKFDRRTYAYASFTQGEMHRDSCSGIWKTHNGDWFPAFLGQIRSQFRVEWRIKRPSI